MKKILFAAVLVLVSFISFAQTKIYAIGDTGPAGGIIFYDKGDNSDGWRYLEAAPAETEWNLIQWGAYEENVVGTSEAIGTGKRNTQLIVEHLNRIGETNKAAQLCDNLNFNGFTDWFLPSTGEMELMYKNLKQKGLSGFADDRYWTSSQDNEGIFPQDIYGIAWLYAFDNYNGFSDPGTKYFTFRVRAVRAF